MIPAYNESARLPGTLAALTQSIQSGALPGLEIVDVVVVDDGSTDDTSTQARAPFRTVRLDRNRGKGAAVREGLRVVRGDWALIADADQSTPWDQLNRLVLAAQESGARIAIGSRGLAKSQLDRRQSKVREILGKAFNRFIVLLTGLPFKDTQCGFKLAHLPSVRPWLSELAVDRFAWDVEFLMLAMRRQIPIVEVPVIWRHEDGSKVRVVRDGLRMVTDFLKIRVRVTLKSLKM